MDDIYLMPIFFTIFVCVVAGGISYTVYSNNEVAKIAIINRCELIQLKCSENPIWANCKGPITPETK